MERSVSKQEIQVRSMRLSEQSKEVVQRMPSQSEGFSLASTKEFQA